MIKKPTARKRQSSKMELNLIPILDSIFILLFFLLLSSSFLKIFEISSDAPIISSRPSKPTKKNPFLLTLKITSSGLYLYKGVNMGLIKYLPKKSDGSYDNERLHNALIRIKKRNKKENTIIFEPTIDIPYQTLVEIMDSSRILRKTDPAIYIKNKDGTEEKLKSLFSNIVFGNIQS